MTEGRKTGVVVIGAGLAGLTAARQLQLAGVRVRVFESRSRLGGRVASSVQDGFTLDEGFQVLFTAYPAVRRNLDLARLELILLPPAAVICRGREREALGYDPGSLRDTLRAKSFSLHDKFLLLRLAVSVKSSPLPQLLLGDDEATGAFLRRTGFSDRAIAAFFTPFFGGIFLKRDLSTSARLFRYYFRLLLDGQIAIPRGGMGRVAAQLAEGLEVSLETRVTRLTPHAGGVTVELEGKTLETETLATETLEAKTVVVATDPPELRRLTGLAVAAEGVSSSYLYFASDTRLDGDKRLLLSGGESGSVVNNVVNNAIWLSNSDQQLAPTGQQLLSVTALGAEALGAEDLERQVRLELSAWYGDAAERLRLLKIIRVPFAQYAQPAGCAASRLGNETSLPHVYLASELTSMSSIQGAMESGERAAALILGRGVRARGG